MMNTSGSSNNKANKRLESDAQKSRAAQASVRRQRTVIVRWWSLALLWLILPSPVWSADAKWPEMKEVAVNFPVDFKTQKIEIDLPLSDKTGKLQYLFWCRGGGDEYLATQTVGDDFLVGPFSCGLKSSDKNSDKNLLGEDDSPLWHTRGQYHYAQLFGKCGDYPEFGRARTFALRGFRLTLTVSDVKINSPGEVTYFSFGVSLKTDKSAIGSIAQRPDYLSPYGEGKSCEIIRKGKDPRYCRDWETRGGSWDSCRDQ
jgi:hypothetical protein